MRKCLGDTRAGDKAELAQDMTTIYRADSPGAAKENYQAFRAKWEKRSPKVVRCWETNLNHLLTFYNFEAGLRRYIYTTNVLERLHKEIERQIKVIGAFSIEHSMKKCGI